MLRKDLKPRAAEAIAVPSELDGSGRRFSIVISNWNYGHFLRECIQSVLDQTLRPDEIIVVDDGSTDGSEAVLAEFETRVHVIRQPNAGQAGAMEAGFRQSTGAIVLFLDSDDLLKPTALEAIDLCWNPSFAVLSFGLDMIDRAGAARGGYFVQPLTGDMRPWLLSEGGFWFMPTSGNAFNRQALERIFPIPRERWRISADAVLLHGAALRGEIRPLGVSLGCYRTHAANNYFQEASSLWTLLRELRDTGDLCRYFSNAVALGDIVEPDIAVDRQFRLAEIKAQARRRILHDRKSRVGPALVAAIASELRRPLAEHALRYAILYVMLLPGVWQRQSWIFRHTRPYPVDRLFFTLLGKDATEERRNAMRPRFLDESGYNEKLTGIFHKDVITLSRHDWRYDDERGATWLCGGEGAIYFKLKYSAEPVRVICMFEVTDSWASTPLDISLAEDGELVATTRIFRSGQLEYILPAERTLEDGIVDLRVKVKPCYRSHWRNFSRTASMMRLVGLTLAPCEPDCTGVALPAGVPIAFETIAGGCLAEGRLVRDPDEGAFLDGGFATLRFRFAGSSLPPTLGLRFGSHQQRGWLLVKWQDRLLFDGEIGPDARIVFECPCPLPDPSNTVDLALSFAPDDEFGEMRIVLRSLWHIPGAHRMISNSAGSPDRPVSLSPGQQAIPADDGFANRIFSHGWSFDPLDGAVLRDTTGLIEFVMPAEFGGRANVRLDLAPRGAFSEDDPDNLIVSAGIDGRPLARVNLKGEHTLDLPLPGADGVPANTVRLLVHAVGVDADGRQGPRPGALVVRRIALAPTAPMVLDQPEITPARPESFHAAIEDAAEMAREEAEQGLSPEAAADFLRRHAAIVEAFRLLSLRAVAPTLAHSGALARLAEIGRGYRLLQGAAVEAARSDWAGEDGLRSFAIDMLTRPAWRCAGSEALAGVPPLAAAFPEAVAAWLAEPPPQPAKQADLALYGGHAAALYRACRDLLQREYFGSRYFVLARETFRRIEPNRLLFSTLNLREFAEAEGEARRTLLQIAGSGPVYAPPATAPGTRIRLAVLAKGLSPGPEGWLLFGMYRGLDRSRFHTTLYLLERTETPRSPDGIFDSVLCLEDLTIDQGVATIRAGGHDVLMLAGYPGGEGPMSETAAHRLARTQVATSAVSPRSTGLASFDVMLSSRLTEPENAAEHYCEELHLWDAPVQCFDFGAAAPAARKSPNLAKRKPLGVGRERTVLVSGAMANKIGDDLAAAWARILADCPQATLVLYPFPRNWRQPYAKDRFRQTLVRIFEASGVAADRLLILDDLSGEQVRDLLAAADLYLDSFPYAGATTVIEALHSGLPVVTLAGGTQRGLQGAGWLRAYGLDEGVAATAEDYVARAVRLATDKAERQAYRRHVVEALLERAELNDPEVFGRRFGGWLETVAVTPRRPTPARR